MKNVSSKKGWTTGVTQPHVDPPMVPLIKENYNGKSKKYFVKHKLRRDPASPTSNLYGIKMSLLDNSDPEEFLLLHFALRFYI